MLAMMRDRSVARPEAAHDLHALFEDFLIVLERNLEGQVLAPVIAAAGGKIDPAVREQVERCPLLGDPDRMMKREYGDRRREADASRPRCDVGQHQVGTRENAERAEVMLADPGRMEPDLLGINRLVEDIGDKGVRGPVVVLVMVVAQREVAELHLPLPFHQEMRRPRGTCKRGVLKAPSIGFFSQPKILSANPDLLICSESAARSRPLVEYPSMTGLNHRNVPRPTAARSRNRQQFKLCNQKVAIS